MEFIIVILAILLFLVFIGFYCVELRLLEIRDELRKLNAREGKGK